MWILDSDCSYHMCPNRDWFGTYEPCNGGNVLMGNDEPYKAIGMSTIKIKIPDEAVRTLGGVRHVPALKKNLISLSTLKSKGCSFNAKDGVCLKRVEEFWY